MRRSSFLLLALSLPLYACGGGGEDPPSANALFAGEYHAFFLKAFDNGGQRTMTSGFGKLRADGAGVITTILTENENGIVSGPAPLTLLTYEVAPDRIISWFFPAISSDEAWRGAISETGDVVMLSSILDGSDPEIVVAFRTGSELDARSLDGNYFWMQFGRTSQADAGLLGAVRFDGANTVDSIVEVVNHDGRLLDNLFPVEGTGEYDVASDGSVGAAPFEERYAGGLGSNGDLVVLGGGETQGGNPGLVAYVRQTTPFLPAPELATAYFVVGLRHLSDSDRYRSMFGRLTGEGGGFLSLVRNTNGTAGATSASGVFLSVAPDGRLEVRLDGDCDGSGACLRGGLTSDGSLGVVGGGHVENADPAIYFLMKR